MRVVRLDSFGQVNEYGLGWNDLLDLDKDSHIFLTLEWLETWWKHFGANRRLLLLAVEDRNRILALAPLMTTTYKLLGVGLTNVEFIGNPVSDYQSFVLRDDPSECTRMILDYLRDEAWDCIELKNIPEDSETARQLKANSGKLLKTKDREIDVCPYVLLPDSPGDYLGRLKSKQRQTLRRNKRLLSDKHTIEYKFFDQMDLTLREAMNIFFRLHQLRWQSRGHEGLFADEVFRNFHMEVAERFDSKRWLRLQFLVVDGEPISADYCFQYGQKVYGYLSGFDPCYSHFGVGNMSFFCSVEDAIMHGFREFDLLRGAHSYKDSWACLVRKNIEIWSVRRRPIAKAYEWLIKNDIIPSLSSRLRRRVLSGMTRS